MEKIIRPITIIAIICASIFTIVSAGDTTPPLLAKINKQPAESNTLSPANIDNKSATENVQPPEATNDMNVASTNRGNPFAPSKMILAMAAMKNKASANPSAATMSGDALYVTTPTLEAIIVRDNKVLAYFVMGNVSFVAEPGNTLGTSGMTFVAYEKDAAVLRDPQGKTHFVRLTFKPAATSPQKPAADTTSNY